MAPILHHALSLSLSLLGPRDAPYTYNQVDTYTNTLSPVLMLAMLILILPALMEVVVVVVVVVVVAPRGEASWNHCASPRRSSLSSHTRLPPVSRYVLHFRQRVRVSREFKAASSCMGIYIERRMKRGESETQGAAVAGTYVRTRRQSRVRAKRSIVWRAFASGRAHLS